MTGIPLNVQEPLGSPLWTAVKSFADPWPPDQEGDAWQMGLIWAQTAEQATRAGQQASAAAGRVPGVWPDAAGQSLHGRVGDYLTGIGQLGQEMETISAAVSRYATELMNTKKSITSTIESNEDKFAALGNLGLGQVGVWAQKAFAAVIAGALEAMVAAAAAGLRGTLEGQMAAIRVPDSSGQDLADATAANAASWATVFGLVRLDDVGAAIGGARELDGEHNYIDQAMSNAGNWASVFEAEGGLLGGPAGAAAGVVGAAIGGFRSLTGEDTDSITGKPSDIDRAMATGAALEEQGSLAGGVAGGTLALAVAPEGALVDVPAGIELGRTVGSAAGVDYGLYRSLNHLDRDPLDPTGKTQNPIDAEVANGSNYAQLGELAAGGSLDPEGDIVAGLAADAVGSGKYAIQHPTHAESPPEPPLPAGSPRPTEAPSAPPPVRARPRPEPAEPGPVPQPPPMR